MEIQHHKNRSRSRKRTRTIALVLVLVAFALLFWIWNNANTARTATSTSATTVEQINEEGQVTIKVTWQGRSSGLVFTTNMDTHAVDLDSYDLRRLAILRTDQGQQIQPSGWNAPAGGHHRTGTLTFPTTTASGVPVIGPKTHALELIIRNVSGIPERSFRWTF